MGGCNCGNKGKTFVVTYTQNGVVKTAEKPTEIEASSMARRLGGSYRVK